MPIDSSYRQGRPAETRLGIAGLIPGEGAAACDPFSNPFVGASRQQGGGTAVETCICTCWPGASLLRIWPAAHRLHAPHRLHVADRYNTPASSHDNSCASRRSLRRFAASHHSPLVCFGRLLHCQRPSRLPALHSQQSPSLLPAGFELGIRSMKVGGKRRIIVPPKLGPPVGPSTFFSAKQCEVGGLAWGFEAQHGGTSALSSSASYANCLVHVASFAGSRSPAVSWRQGLLFRSPPLRLAAPPPPAPRLTLCPAPTWPHAPPGV